MGYKIFLSHSSKDGFWIEQIAQKAKKEGIDPYLYEYDHQPGKIISEKIEKAIQNCDALVALITHNFSPSVHEEIAFARKENKLIVPLIEVGLPENAMGFIEKEKEYILIDFNKPDETIEEVLKYLRKNKGQKEKTQNDRDAIIAITAIITFLFLTIVFGNEDK